MFFDGYIAAPPTMTVSLCLIIFALTGATKLVEVMAVHSTTADRMFNVLDIRSLPI